MGIKCSNIPSFDNILPEIIKIVTHEVERTLSYLGEQCVRRIKDRSAEDSWIDQTGNLRSSIGYAVYDNGVKIMQSTFEQVLQGAEGTKEGEKYIDTLASQYAKTYALVVVAGMSYAEYVEVKESKDVLASTELWAKEKVNEYIKKAKDRAERQINSMKW